MDELIKNVTNETFKFKYLENSDRFYDIFEVNKQAIMQAIEVIEADDIDEQKRKETVAILYLMLGENNEALKRLDED